MSFELPLTWLEILLSYPKMLNLTYIGLFYFNNIASNLLLMKARLIALDEH